MHSILSDTPLPPSRLKLNTARALDALVLQMLEKDPRLRPVAPEVETALAELAQKDKGLLSRPTGVPVMRHTDWREKELAELHAGYPTSSRSPPNNLLLPKDAIGQARGDISPAIAELIRCDGRNLV